MAMGGSYKNYAISMVVCVLFCLYAVSAALLRAVQRLVRPLHKDHRGVIIVKYRHDKTTGHFPNIRERMIFDNVAKLFGQPQTTVHVAADTQNDKLLSAPPGENIMDPDFTADQTGKFGQHRVSNLMAEDVINIFEIINIKENQGHRMPVTFCAFDLLPDGLVERASVKNAGEFVGGSQCPKVLFEFLPTFNLR